MTDPVAPWRLRVAVWIVALLAIGLATTTLTSGPGSAEGSRSVPVITSIAVSSRTNTTTAVPGSASLTADDQVRRVVREALAAWGEFAASGDLNDLEGFFDPDGPQWESLSAEAGSGGVGFTPEIVERSLHVGADSSVFVADITFAANGDSQTVTWRIDLKQMSEGGWRIWSVSDTPDQ